MREVVLAKDKDIQKACIAKVYTWYYKKLKAIGELSEQDKEEEDILTSPLKIEKAIQRKEQSTQQKRLNLLNQSLIVMKDRKMFDNEERTLHKDIPPAKTRIQTYKKKSFGKLFQQYQEDRPMSGVT